MKIQDITKETDKQEANITSLIQNHEAEMTMRLQNDANDLQMRFSEIDQKVKAFASQMQVYQTADALKAKLDSEISRHVDNYLRRADTFLQHITTTEPDGILATTFTDGLLGQSLTFFTQARQLATQE